MIIFSDESKIELLPLHREYVRRQKKDSKFDEWYIPKNQEVFPSLIVWSAVRGDDYWVLLRSADKVNQHHYQVLLDEELPQIYNSSYEFHHDGTSRHTESPPIPVSHTAHTIKLYLERNSSMCWICGVLRAQPISHF